MSEKKMKQWYVQVEWENGTTEQLHAFHLPDCVTEEIETHIKELEDYHNGGWDMAYEEKTK